MECQPFEKKLTQLYYKINSIELIDASEEVQKLFDEFRLTCKAPSAMEVTSLSKEVQEMKFKLLEKWGIYEGLLEKRYANLMLACENPLDNLNLYPHYDLYLIRMVEEYKLTMKYSLSAPPKHVAFLGSGALPISTIILARDHLTTTRIDNFDFDPCANDLAARLTAALPNPMGFYTKNVMELTSEDIAPYEIVFLGALVGVDKVEKLRIIAHLANIMAYGSVLMVRGAYGTKSFIYPPVAPEEVCGFEVQGIWHPKTGSGPTNSVIIAKKVNYNDDNGV